MNASLKESPAFYVAFVGAAVGLVLWVAMWFGLLSEHLLFVWHAKFFVLAVVFFVKQPILSEVNPVHRQPL